MEIENPNYHDLKSETKILDSNSQTNINNQLY